MILHPREPAALGRAYRLAAQGRAHEAQAVLHEALLLEPNLPQVHLALARLRWPGADYRHWLGWLHQRLQPEVYLEIGVEKGESLALARPPSRTIGVDPAPVGDPLALCTVPTSLYPMKSADFLRSPPPGCELHTRGFDLALVDGDHRMESVLDDFTGLEAWAAPGALVVLHDTLPLTPLTAAPQRQSGFYTGDGWKVVACLRGLRPALRIVTLPVAPSGLTLVTGLDPRSTLLRERRADILDSYRHLDPRRAIDRPDAVLGTLGVNDPAWVYQWLRDAGVPLHS